VRPPKAQASLPFEGRSSHKDDYVVHTMPPRTPPTDWQPPTPSHKLETSTTTGDDYREKPLAPLERWRPPKAQPSLPFEGRSSHKDDYQVPKAQPREPQSDWEPSAPPVAFAGSSTTKDDYQAHVQLEGKVPSLGVLFRGSKGNGVNMYELIRADARLPTRGSQIFTTVVDGQAAMVMRVIAEVAGEKSAIGAFELSAKGGMYTAWPKVEVKLQLDERMVLAVSAMDLSDGNRSQLIVRDIRPGSATGAPVAEPPRVGASQPGRSASIREQRLAERERQRSLK